LYVTIQISFFLYLVNNKIVFEDAKDGHYDGKGRKKKVTTTNGLEKMSEKKVKKEETIKYFL
tara:strand:- start:594 stop:779 length:186 start_codon:yes stop_codon:yes gene_type:complete